MMYHESCRSPFYVKVCQGRIPLESFMLRRPILFSWAAAIPLRPPRCWVPLARSASSSFFACFFSRALSGCSLGIRCGSPGTGTRCQLLELCFTLTRRTTLSCVFFLFFFLFSFPLLFRVREWQFIPPSGVHTFSQPLVRHVGEACLGGWRVTSTC
jgi:hypothetical protein